MPIAVTAVALAAIVWGAIVARRASLVIGCGLLVVVAYAFGHPFWNVRIGPLPITLDRVVLVGLVGTLAVQWRIGRVRIRPLTAADWALLAMLFVVGASAVASGQPEFSDGVTSKWGRLVTSFLIPATLFFVARQIHITRRESSWLLVGFVLFGVYLGVTALFEIAGAWSLVFPRYIANPALGIHFGRARGPDLNSVSLGLYLTACIWCAWTLLGEEAKRWQQLAVLVTLPLMAAGVFFTYTRSTWLGLAASALVIGAIGIPRRWRLPALATSALVGMLVVAASWTQLTGLEREGSAAESSHSVDQRTSFAYVSWQMFRDNPVFGVGFGRFYDRKLPYLSDRSQDFELESIRPLHHHNTLLSLLTETGLIGLAAFVAMLGIWVRSAWRLIQNGESPRWVRSFGVLMLALAVNYFCSALFHDLTLLPSQHLLLFAFAGFMVNLHQQASSQLIEGWHALRLREGREVENIATPFEDSEPATRVELFGMQIDCVTMPDAVNRVLDWCYEPRQNTCRYIVTPNVNHAVLFERRADLRAAYVDASLVLADGAPIVVASRLLNRALPERVAGSDLVPRLFDMADRPLKVFLLGAEPGIAQAASKRIERQSHKVEVVGAYSPPIGFENNKLENARIIALIAAAAPDLVVVGLGAPKQELWVHRHRHQLQAKVVVCAGATIDFLAGHRRRSPVWMRRTGLEWLHRVCTEPRRLASRYARDAWIFPQLVWREWRRANV